MEDAVRLLQLVINGAAAGCIYGLIALGFVLIYKATEMVNFAQGEIMMLGGFVAYSCVATWGMNYWLGGAIAIAVTAAFGFALDAVVLRRVIGQPQFAVVMLTLGLGFIFRAGAGIAWGYDAVGFNTPFTNKTARLGPMILGQDNLSIIVGTVILCGVLYVFFSKTRLGVAMQASSQNQLAAYYMGIPVRTIFSLIWAISSCNTSLTSPTMGMSTLTRLEIDEGSMSMWMILRSTEAKCLGLPITRSSKRAPTASSTSQFCMALLASTVPCIPSMPKNLGSVAG